SRRVDQPDVLEADTFEVVGAPLRGTPHVALVLRQRADARNGEVLFQLVDVAVALYVDVVDDFIDVLHGSSWSGLTVCSDAQWADRRDRPIPSTIRRSCARADSRAAAMRGTNA